MEDTFPTDSVDIRSPYMHYLGEMRDRIKSYPWSESALGPQTKWPASLKTTLEVILGSDFPMVLLWGEEMVMLYNDAYRQTLGASGKHPFILGKAAKDAWPESWTIIEPLLLKVMHGETCSFENLETPFMKNGRIEKSFWTFSYSPVKDDGKVVGVFIVCQETTRHLHEQFEQQRLTESIIAASPTLTYVYDLEKNENIFASPQVADILGYTPEEVQLMSSDFLLMAIFEKDAPLVQESMQRLLHDQKGEVFELEYRVRRKDGQLVWLSDRSRVFKRDIAGKPTQILGVATDITERKQLAERLSQQYEELQMIYNSAPVGLCLINADYQYTRINKRLAEINGLSVEEHIGHSIYEVIPELAPQIENLLNDIFERGEALMNLEIKGYTKAQPGVERIWNENWYPIKDAQGKTVAVSIVAEEVTEQRRAQQALSELANAMPQLVWIADSSGTVTFYNDQAQHYEGVYRKDDGSWAWNGLVHPDEMKETAARWEAAIHNGAVYAFEHRIKVKDQGYRWHLSRAFPQKDADGKIYKWFGTATDIHEQKLIEEQLKTTKTQLELTIQNIPAMVFLLTSEGRVVFLNDKGAKLFGLENSRDPAVISLLNIHKVFKERFEIFEMDGSPLEFSNSPTSLAFKTGKVSHRTLIFKHRHVDEVQYFLTTSSPLFDDAGKIVMVLTSITDVTFEKLAEQKIKENEALFRSLAESLPQLVWMTDEKGNQLYTSQKWEDYAGIKPQDAATWDQMVHPEDKAAIAEAWRTSLETGVVYKYEIRLRHKSGEYRWHMVEATALRNEQGQISKWIGSFTDIHEQKTLTEKLERLVAERTEELVSLNNILSRKNIDLANARRFLRTVLDSSVEVVSSFDKNLNYAFVNKKAEEFLNKRAKDVLGKNLLEVFPQIAGTESYYQLLQALRGESAYIQQGQSFVNKDRILESYFIPYMNGEEVEGVITLQRDVTPFIRLSEDLQKSNEELLRSNADLQQFAHVTSHDLKEPVRKIKLYSNMIRTNHRNELSEDGKKYFDRLGNATNRISAMIDGILQYSSIDAINETFETIDLNTIIDEVKEDLDLMISQKAATITTHNLPSIVGSRTLVYQLFYNLVNNSLKFISPSRKPIIKVIGKAKHIDSKSKEVYWHIDVADNGIGFEETYAEKIFESFQRLHPKDQYEGTGLGLALCRRIVMRHKGYINAKGNIGEGAVFSVYFPMTQRT